MNVHGQKLNPGIASITLLRARPAAQDALDRLQLDPWADPRMTLGGVCEAKGIAWTDLEAALRSLPETLPERDWEAESIPMLLDHLVQDHADLQRNSLPAIRNALTRALSSAGGSSLIGYLAEAWPGFTAELAAHMKEEEVFLFPRLLHYAWCVGHSGQHPDFSGGSVNVFIALHLMGNEDRQMEALQRFMAGWETASPAEAMVPEAESELRRLLETFFERLRRHNHLESALLFPRAKALEKTLYDAAISGRPDSRFPIAVSP